MLYIILIVVIIVVLFFILAILDSYAEYKNKSSATQLDEDYNEEYHIEKHKKIKAQYYRGIQAESKNQFLTQEYNIVGVEKPKGKWTAMVIKRNLQYMTTLKNLTGNNFFNLGVWQLKVKAQSLLGQGINRARGMGKGGRGR